MNGRTFQALAVGVPVLIGLVLPNVLFSVFYGEWGTNLFWGAIFGFGWWLALTVAGPEDWSAPLAFLHFCWPVLVLLACFLTGRAVWLSDNCSLRTAFLTLLGLSCLPMVPAHTAMALYAHVKVPLNLNMLMAEAY